MKKFKLLGFAVLFVVFMLYTVVVATNDLIETHKRENNSANCVEEFETVECFNERINTFQIRRELKLYSEGINRQ